MILLRDSEKIIEHLNSSERVSNIADMDLTHLAMSQYERIYDEKYGGFGCAPKFPTPHNLLLLLDYYERYKTASCLK